MPKQPDGSLVGVRSSWTCVLCGVIERTYQLLRLGHPEPLTPPRGWLVVGGSSVCGQHTLENGGSKGGD